jgi:hypothetical protein
MPKAHHQPASIQCAHFLHSHTHKSTGPEVFCLLPPAAILCTNHYLGMHRHLRFTCAFSPPLHNFPSLPLVVLWPFLVPYAHLPSSTLTKTALPQATTSHPQWQFRYANTHNLCMQDCLGDFGGRFHECKWQTHLLHIFFPTNIFIMFWSEWMERGGSQGTDSSGDQRMKFWLHLYLLHDAHQLQCTLYTFLVVQTLKIVLTAIELKLLLITTKLEGGG